MDRRQPHCHCRMDISKSSVVKNTHSILFNSWDCIIGVEAQVSIFPHACLLSVAVYNIHFLFSFSVLDATVL